jgi:ATP-binding cassette subfamily B protein RaxB
MNLFKPQKPKLIFQETSEDCGFACVAMLLNAYGQKTTIEKLKRLFPNISSPLSFQHITHIFHYFGMETAVIYAPETFPIQPQGRFFIAHLLNNHFVLAANHDKQKYKILDPENGQNDISTEKFCKKASGLFLEVKQKKKTKLIRHLTTKMKYQIVKLGLLILFTYFILFLTPWILEQAIDSINKSNSNLFIIFGIGYLILKIIESLFQLFKNLSFTNMGLLLNTKLSKIIIQKIIKLPYIWVLGKQTAEIYNLSASVQKLPSLYVDGIIEGLADGIMAFLMCFILLFYSLPIFLLIFIFTSLLIVSKLICIKYAKPKIESSIKYKIQTDQHLFDFVKSMKCLRVFNCQLNLGLSWIKKFITYNHQLLHLNYYKNFYQVWRNFLLSVELLLLVTFTLKGIKIDKFTIGFFYSILFYRNLIHDCSNRLLDKLQDFQLTVPYIQKIKHLLQEKEQPVCHQPFFTDIKSIEINNLAFKYPNTDKYCFKNLSLQFEMNQTYAIVGASGCGKTTLLYLLMGLLQPSEGHFILNGQHRKNLVSKRYYQQIASVLQDDYLFPGSIIRNITLGKNNINISLVEKCLNLANLDGLVSEMPLKYYSSIGENGQGLSGGQRQKLLLARALYKQPKMLFLDEATSHLDATSELAIIQNLRQLPMTQIIVAHRQETIRQADVIIDLSKSNSALLA